MSHANGGSQAIPVHVEPKSENDEESLRVSVSIYHALLMGTKHD